MADFIFVVGIGRSGTSLLQNMLNAHSEICFLPENSFLRRYLASGLFDSRLKSSGANSLAAELASDIAFKRIGMSADELEGVLNSQNGQSGAAFFRSVASSYAGQDGQYSYLGDKDPRLIEFLPLLHANFPNARIIHIYRDPRDVALSKMKAEWSSGRAAIANLFAGRAQWSLVGRNGRALFGSNFHELSYENLVNLPKAEMVKVCEFLDIDFVTEMLDPASGGRTLVAEDEMPWKHKSLGPVLSTNTEKWRSGLSPEQVALTESVNRRLMRDAGYGFSESFGTLSALGKCRVLAQSAIVSLIEPLYCRYRMWSQRP